LARTGVGPESGFPWAQSDKSGPEVKHGLLPPEVWGPLNRVLEGTWALPDLSGDGERHDRFGVVVGEGVVEPRIEGRFARRSVPEWQADEEAQTEGDAVEVIDVSAHEPRRIPSKKWRELIKKVWEADPLRWPNGSRENAHRFAHRRLRTLASPHPITEY